MKLFFPVQLFALALIFLVGCHKSQAPQAVGPVSQAELSEMANKVAKTGPREGNNYKVFYLALRQNQKAAVGFKIDAHVQGKSEPITKRTNERGLAVFDNLPFPDSKHRLVTKIHYYQGKDNFPREIAYPFIDSDAYRLKDVQYIPNTVTPDPS